MTGQSLCLLVGAGPCARPNYHMEEGWAPIFLQDCASRQGAALPIGPHRIVFKRVRTTGFEPAISCTRSTRNTRLSHTLFVKSAQWESNPHVRHGKATGCRYIMGACVTAELSKIQEHRVGLEPTLPLTNAARRCPGAVSLPLNDQCLFVSGTGGYRTHIIRFKRPVHYRVCHGPDSVGAVGVEPTTCVL